MDLKKLLKFAPFVAIVLAIVGYFAIFGHSKIATPSGGRSDFASSSTKADDGGSGPTPEETRASDLSKYTSAVDAMDRDACSEIADDEFRQKCEDNVYSAFAAKENDPEYCSKIINPDVRSKCSDSFTYDEAVRKGDSTLCRKLSEPELAKSCLRTVTFAKIESGTGTRSGTGECANLDAPADRAYCVNRITNSASVDFAKEAILKKDRSLCLKITDKVLSNSCSDAIVLETVASSGDSSSCALVTDPAKQAKCQSVAWAIGDSSKFRSAMETGDSSICSTISSKDLKTRCADVLMLKTAISSKDSSKCSTISSSSMKSQCLAATTVK